MGYRRAKRAPETPPVGETGVARAEATGPEGPPDLHKPDPMQSIAAVAGAESRGDGPVRRQGREPWIARGKSSLRLFVVSLSFDLMDATQSRLGR